MSLARALWSEHRELADQALQHPFVRGIADGTLPRDLFRGYVAQDAFFLDAFARAYAMALVASPDPATMLAFADLVAGVRDELRLHADYAKRWRINTAAAEPRAATLAYTDFLLATAATRRLGLVCAAMTPCMRLYAFLGQSLAGQHPSADNPYASWVETYSDPAFEALAGRLEALLDRLADHSAETRTAYGRAMRLELGFFDAAWTG